jgi:hypothetical protein
MKAIHGYHLIKPEDLHWRPSNLMKIPNADYLERTGSENIGARLWRLPPKSANTLHKHIRSEEFYFDLSLIYPVDPTQLPKELAGVEWPPKGSDE